MLISSNQDGFFQDMALHGRPQFVDIRMAKIRQISIEGVELEKIAMSTDGRAGATITGTVPAIETLEYAGRRLTVSGGFR